MPANMRNLMKEVPRPLEMAAKDYAAEKPLDRTQLSRKEIARRLEPIVGLIATGEIPLDEHAGQAIAAYLEEHHARTQRH